MAQQFPTLFSPIKIGPITIRNRIVSSSHHPLFISRGTGQLDDRMINYWVSKAKGGVGLIESFLTTLHCRPERDIFRYPGAVEAFGRAADAIHAHGAKFICQIANSGSQGTGFGEPAGWAPSAVPAPDGQGYQNVPHEMTVDEIHGFVEAFANATRVCKQAGADGVQIHGAHGYLLTEFMSPYYNRRTDAYGGSLEARMKFPLEVIDAVHDAAGDDFVVGIRLSADEFQEDGLTLEEMKLMAPMMAKTGKIDYMSISSGNYATIGTAIDSMYYPMNSFVFLAAAVKEAVDIPIVARGRIIDPVQAEEILADNQADMVSMVRGLISDPELPNKAMEGRLDEIRTCIGCSEACWGSVYFLRNLSQGISCTMNPTIGKEGDPGWGELIPAAKKKSVLIIGGGPAGLEAARVAGLRGHDVSLYDRGDELGGQIRIAAKAPNRDGFLDLIRYYTYQMKLIGVNVHLNTEVTAEIVTEQAPDAVIVASGSVPLVPHIRGINSNHVVNVWQVLDEETEVGDNVVVIADDDHIQGLSAADFLADRGKKVEVICWGYAAGPKIEPATRQALYQRLLRNDVTLTPNTRVREITGRTVVTVNHFSDKERRIEGVDTVVIASGNREDNALYYALRNRVPEVHLVGDANGVRKIHNATMDAARIARTL